MANYNTQFSFEVKLQSKEEAAWVTSLINKMEAAGAPDEVDDVRVMFDHEIDELSLCLMDDAGETDLSTVTDLLQEYLEKFHPTKAIGFECAHTCSRPVIDAFGGGACVVTNHKVYWSSTGDWIDDKLGDLKRQGIQPLEGPVGG